MVQLNLKQNIYKNCDVLFLHPSYQPHWSCYEPTGLISIATYLNSKNINSKIIDLNILKQDQKKICELIINNNIKVVGISAITRQAERAYEIGKIIKINCHNTKIIYGGVHPTALQEEPFEKGMADYVVPYEGEKTIYYLSRLLLKNKSAKHIAGILYRNGKKIVKNKPRGFIKNLDNLPFLDYSLVDLEKYNTNIHIKEYRGKTINMLTSRGCLGNCIYCNSPSLYKRKIREKTAQNIVNEIYYQIKNSGIINVHFTDDDFLSKSNKIKKLCIIIIKNKIQFNWICIVRADSIIKAKKIIKYMKQAGCVGVEIGVETPSDLILKSFNKNESSLDIINANDILLRENIKPMYLFMSYCPGENISSPFNALKAYCQLKKIIINKKRIPIFKIEHAEDLAGHIMRVSPGAQIYNFKGTFGIDLTSCWTDHFEENLGFLPFSILNDIPQLTYKKYLDIYILKKIYIKYRKNLNLFINQNFYISTYLFEKYFNNSYTDLFNGIYKVLVNINGINSVKKICNNINFPIQKTIICFSVLSLLGIIESKSCKI